MTDYEYKDLKKQIIIAFNERHNEMLNVIKQSFKDIVDSTRRYELIKDLEDLLAVLEMRDQLSKYNVEPLKTIAGILNGEDLLRENINNYESACLPRNYVNVYEDNEIIQPTTFSTFNPLNTISERKRTRILDTLVNEIGNSWRDLARYLGVQEGIIDIIDEKHRNNSAKVMEMLNRYEKTKADPQQWFFVLCEALDKCRRRDLSKSLQKVITMNL